MKDLNRIDSVITAQDADGGPAAGGKAAGTEQDAEELSSQAANRPVAAELSSPKLLRHIRGIIFDFDGTLFDNVRLPFYLVAAFPFDLLRIWKERLIRKQFAGCDYSSPEEYYDAFFAALGKSCLRSSDRMRNWYFRRYMPRMIRVLGKHYRLRPGVAELIRRLDAPESDSHSKISPLNFPKLAIYSDYPFVKERMEAMGVCPGPRVRLYGPPSFGAQKPAARPFLRIAADFGVAPEEVLVIGDREDTDGLGAFHAGMRFFCLETGRKRYYKLDPYRCPPMKNEEPHGPSLMMHAGTWDDLIKLFKEKYSN